MQDRLGEIVPKFWGLARLGRTLLVRVYVQCTSNLFVTELKKHADFAINEETNGLKFAGGV